MKMLCGVPVLRIIATSDMAARAAQPEVHPRIADSEAFLATVSCRLVGTYEIKMAAFSGHFALLASIADISTLWLSRTRSGGQRGHPCHAMAGK
jgi:hypothetical protein